jgi:hypothetical protein
MTLNKQGANVRFSCVAPTRGSNLTGHRQPPARDAAGPQAEATRTRLRERLSTSFMPAVSLLMSIGTTCSESFARFDNRIDETANQQYAIVMLQIMRPGWYASGCFHF